MFGLGFGVIRELGQRLVVKFDVGDSHFTMDLSETSRLLTFRDFFLG